MKKLREAAGLKQSEAAKALKCSKSYLSHLERGRKRPNIEMVVKMANLYKVSVSDIIAVLGYKCCGRCITIYDKATRELIANVCGDDLIIHNNYEAEITYTRD